MTYEEVKKIREKLTASDVDNKELQKMIDEAIEKQIWKKPKHNEYGVGYCPNCDECLDYNGVNRYPFCADCGQAIDWSE